MHSGRDKCWARINERYYWHGGYTFVKEKTRECVYCAQKNQAFNEAPVAPLCTIPVTPKAMWRIHCDLFGPLPKTKSGNAYVAVAICAFTKYVEAMRNFLFHSNFLVQGE